MGQAIGYMSGVYTFIFLESLVVGRRLLSIGVYLVFIDSFALFGEFLRVLRHVP